MMPKGPKFEAVNRGGLKFEAEGFGLDCVEFNTPPDTVEVISEAGSRLKGKGCWGGAGRSPGSPSPPALGLGAPTANAFRTH